MKKQKLFTLFGNICLVLMLAALLLTSCAKQAPAPEKTAADILGGTIGISTYDVGTSGNSIATAWAETFRKELGVPAMVIPGKNDMARIFSMLNGEAELGVISAASHYVPLMGQQDFVATGPVPIRHVWGGFVSPMAGLLAKGDSDIKTLADVKGKKIAYFPVGYPAGKLPIDAMLAFVNLTIDDCVAVPFAGLTDGVRALMDRRVDVCLYNTQAPLTQEAAVSPGGIRWLNMPAEDKEGWKRVKAIMPPYAAMYVPWAVGVQGPVTICGYDYSTISLQTVPEDVVYLLVKCLAEHEADYADVNIGGMKLDLHSLEQTLNPELTIAPWHPGTIKYAKEKGLWTDAQEKHNQKLLAEEQARIAAFKGKK